MQLEAEAGDFCRRGVVEDSPGGPRASLVSYRIVSCGLADSVSRDADVPRSRSLHQTRRRHWPPTTLHAGQVSPGHLPPDLILNTTENHNPSSIRYDTLF